MTRVLHVINTLTVGGGSAHLALLTAGLRALAHDNAVLALLDGAGGDPLRAASIPVRAVGHAGWRAPTALARAITESRADLLHLHGTRAGFYGALVTQRARIDAPLVYTGHALAFHRRDALPLRGVFSRVERFIASQAAAVLVLTESDRALALQHGFPPGRTFVVPNGIDVERFARARADRDALGIPSPAPLVGWIGRFVPQKNPLAMVRVARRVLERRPDVHVLLMGDGPLHARVAREVRAHPRVHLVGARTDVPSALAAMDVYVTTARWEGLPLTVMEAMAAARPVVATAIPAHAVLLASAGAGVLVGEHEDERMGDAVVDLLDQPALRAAMGARSQEAARASFSAATMVRRTAEIYEAVLQEHRRARGGAQGPGSPTAPRVR